MAQKSHTEKKHNEQVLPAGVYGVDYYEGRRKKRQLIYRLRRRTDEVERSIRKFSSETYHTILDIGTADALMLDLLRERLGPLTFLGIEYNIDLLKSESFPGIHKIQANALKLPVKSKKVDVIIATAVIEHVTNPALMLKESYRVLRPDGIIILTTPNPGMDWIAEKIGLLKESGHQTKYTLKKLRRALEEHNFQVIDSYKFMFSPIGFPAERVIEKIFGPLGLKLIMANQLIVARKP